MVIASYSALVLFAGLVTVSVEALGVFDPSMIHSRSLATSSSTCPDELTACSADPTCIACATEFASTVEGCFVGSATSCDDVTDAFCCTVDAVDGCEDSPALEALFECFIEDACPIDLDACTSAVAGTTGDDTISSTSCPTEAEACRLDETCTACLSVFGDAADACTLDGSSCDDVDDFLCCAISSGDECEDNAELGAWFECIYEDSCAVDISTCTSGGATADDGNDDANPIFGGDDDTADDEAEETDLINSESSALPSVVAAPMTTLAVLFVAVVASFNF